MLRLIKRNKYEFGNIPNYGILNLFRKVAIPSLMNFGSHWIFCSERSFKAGLSQTQFTDCGTWPIHNQTGALAGLECLAYQVVPSVAYSRTSLTYNSNQTILFTVTNEVRTK